MKLGSKVNKGEKGQVLVLALMLLLAGGITITPLLGFVATGHKAGLMYQEKVAQNYAADAGIKHAIHRIIRNDASIENLEDNDSYSYSLPSPVNGLPVNVKVTRLALIQGILGDEEFKLNQPHESWIDFDMPPEETTRNYSEGWVEYSCNISFYYDGNGNRTVETLGSFFSPVPSEGTVIDDPYSINTTPVFTLDGLESFQTKETGGGFAFIWRWASNQGPEFDNANRSGAMTYKFKVHDPDWAYSLSFSWATFKEQDVSFVTSAELSKWLIEVTAGDVDIRSSIMNQNGSIDILTWEINPPS